MLLQKDIYSVPLIVKVFQWPLVREKTILNVEPEEILDITISEIQLALSQMKSRRVPGEGGITSEIMKLGG